MGSFSMYREREKHLKGEEQHLRMQVTKVVDTMTKNTSREKEEADGVLAFSGEFSKTNVKRYRTKKKRKWLCCCCC